MSCPKCGRVFNEAELVRVLIQSGVSKTAIKIVEIELEMKRLNEAVFRKMFS